MRCSSARLGAAALGRPRRPPGRRVGWAQRPTTSPPPATSAQLLSVGRDGRRRHDRPRPRAGAARPPGRGAHRRRRDADGLGSLATIGVKQPGNLVIVVLDNGHYGETGMQPSHTKAGIDLVAVALRLPSGGARGIAYEEAAEVRALLHAGKGPILVSARIAREDAARPADPRRPRHQAAVYRGVERKNLS